MQVKITSSKEKIFEGKAKSAILPAIRGEIEILDNHSHIFALLTQGQITIKKTEKSSKKINIKSGVAEFYKNKLSIVINN